MYASGEGGLSPISGKAVMASHVPRARYALGCRYSIKRFSTFRRLGGSGYKSAARSLPSPKMTK